MNSSGFSVFRKSVTQAKGFYPHIITVLCLHLFAIPIALLKPYALKLLIDCGFGSQPLPAFIRVFFSSDFKFDFETIAITAAGLVIIIALIENLYIFSLWLLSTYTGEKLVLNFRTRLFNHIQRLSLAYHDSKGASDSLYRIQWDAMSIRSLLLSQLPPLISSLITLGSMIAVMFFINWRFGLIALCLLPPLGFLTRFSTKRLKKDWYKVKNAESLAMSVIHEVLGSLRIVKAFGREENENERFVDRSTKAVEGQVRLARTSATYSFIVGMLLAIGTAIFIYIGAKYVHEGKMTLGELTLIVAYLAQIFGPLQNIIKMLNEVQSSLTGVDRVFTVLNEKKEVKELPNAMHLSHVKGSFQFQDVSFSYRSDKCTLQNISFQVHPGDRVGIMGSTGAGKSTLISLLMRFYDPSGGVITVDGVDIKKYKLQDYRKQFSMVLQEPVLFSTSIRENIRYGRPDATEKEVIEAAIAANAHNFIMKSKDGYETLVGEHGMQLSGGERQRISLARAFIKNAPVLILDEPTSSLDIKTEALIMEAMERLMEGRTTFMITHRLDTLNNCNFILHLENGVLIEAVRDHDGNFIMNTKANFLKQV